MPEKKYTYIYLCTSMVELLLKISVMLTFHLKKRENEVRKVTWNVFSYPVKYSWKHKATIWCVFGLLFVLQFFPSNIFYFPGLVFYLGFHLKRKTLFLVSRASLSAQPRHIPSIFANKHYGGCASSHAEESSVPLKAFFLNFNRTEHFLTSSRM